MKSVLITGIVGFVGSNLARKLREHRLIALDLREENKVAYSAFYTWNNFNEIPRSEIDVIIHLAGKAHDTKSQTKREEYFEINTNLTKRIFDFFLQSDAKKFIYFSSVKAAADRVKGILTEDITPAPRGPYGESKLAAEQYLISKFQSFSVSESQSLKVLDNQSLEPLNSVTLEQINPESGTINSKQLYILRPCMIHGPGNKGNLNQLIKLVKTGFPYPLGAFDNKRSFTSIDNLSFVINELINKNIESGIYNIADDEPVSTIDLVKVIGEVTGMKERIWNINRKFIESLATAGSALKLPFNNDSIQKLTENYIVSNKKIKSALGIPSLPIDTITGLRQTIDYLIYNKIIKD